VPFGQLHEEDGSRFRRMLTRRKEAYIVLKFIHAKMPARHSAGICVLLVLLPDEIILARLCLHESVGAEAG
jgi:hypothetical protein